MSKKLSSSRRSNKRPASGRKPSLELTPGDIEAISDELKAYHRLFHSVFQRREQRYWSLVYLCGQLSDLDRKTIEPMVLALLGPEPNAVRAVEHFISQGAWETQALIQRYQELVAEWLGDPHGVVILDGSGFPKQGLDSVGVAHQYCGALGKLANCQEGVFAVYVSPSGYVFLDARLYVHGDWFDEAHRERWKKCGLQAIYPGQVNARHLVEVLPQVELGRMAARLAGRTLGRRQRLFGQVHLGLEGGISLFQFDIARPDLLPEKVIRLQGLPQHKHVLRLVVAAQRLGDLVFALGTVGVAMAGQLVRVALAHHDVADDLHPRLARDVADHIRQLDVHLLQGLLHVLDLSCARLDHAVAMSYQRAHCANVFGRTEGGAQQPIRVQLLYPLAIQNVGLFARNVLEVARVDQIDFKPALLQHLTRTHLRHKICFWVLEPWVLEPYSWVPGNYSARSAWIAKSKPNAMRSAQFCLPNRRICQSGGSG